MRKSCSMRQTQCFLSAQNQQHNLAPEICIFYKSSLPYTFWLVQKRNRFFLLMLLHELCKQKLDGRRKWNLWRLHEYLNDNKEQNFQHNHFSGYTYALSDVFRCVLSSNWSYITGVSNIQIFLCDSVPAFQQGLLHGLAIQVSTTDRKRLKYNLFIIILILVHNDITRVRPFPEFVGNGIMLFFPELGFVLVLFLRTNQTKQKSGKKLQTSGKTIFPIFTHFPIAICASIIDERSWNFMSHSVGVLQNKYSNIHIANRSALVWPQY